MSEEKKSDNHGIWEHKEFKVLKDHVVEVNKLHLRDLLSVQNKRVETFTVKHGGITLDCTRQKATRDTLQKLISLAKSANLSSKINSMFNGDVINITENRSVLHTALRAKQEDKIIINNINIVDKVHSVLNQIKTFSQKVRNGEWVGYSNKRITNVISIGIGGSYLGSEFVFEALKTYPIARQNANGRQLKFYANIDPIGFARATANMDPETTICIVVSKSFTTRETMMNAQLIREWLISAYNGDSKCLSSHFIAVSANPTLPTEKFGVNKENIFEFWDWVGGRYSVTSAVGILPLSLHYGYDIMQQFLDGANDIDTHFRSNINDKLDNNIPVLLGLFGVWNTTFLGYNTRALIPYNEALTRLPAHIQQLDMESNGKRIDKFGNESLKNQCSGEINVGEPGTNAQHSFFQLLHQGRVVPVDFIGFCKSQLISDNLYNDSLKELIATNHDELMSNLFAQCDALALGKTEQQVIHEMDHKYKKEKAKYDKSIIPHKVFDGNRPSSVLLFDEALNPFKCGQILSIFEHRTAVQGFIWNLCSFDQWGVELGKHLGKDIRNKIDLFKADHDKKHFHDFNLSTQHSLEYYCNKSAYTPPHATLVFIRHGQSEWNAANRFTGWVDVGLTELGKKEAGEGAKEIKKAAFQFDCMFTSYLKRAILTGHMVLREVDQLYIPIYKSWRLNERMYGGLQGLNKVETVEKHGKEQVLKWRRSFDIPPPEIDEKSEYNPLNDRKYKNIDRKFIPKTECLSDVILRATPYWESDILPKLKDGQTVLIAAHGNSIRAILKYLDKISDSLIPSLEIPTGIPLVYRFDKDLNIIKNKQSVAPLSGIFLGDPERIKKAQDKVKNQISKK